MAKIKYIPGAPGIRSPRDPQAAQAPQGLDVDIMSNRVKSPEYPDPANEGTDARAVTVYVESELATELEFQFTVKRLFEYDCDYVEFYISIDGEQLDVGQLCALGHLDKEDSWVDYESGIERGHPDEPGKFIFTKFRTNKMCITEGAAVQFSDLYEKIESLGVLEVRVLRLADAPLIEQQIFEKYEESVAVLPETALKGRAISQNVR